MWKGGNQPFIEAISPTVLVSIPKATTIPKIVRIAINEAGTALVNLGKPHMITIVSKTNPKREYNGVPESHAPLEVLN